MINEKCNTPCGIDIVSGRFVLWSPVDLQTESNNIVTRAKLNVIVHTEAYRVAAKTGVALKTDRSGVFFYVLRAASYMPDSPDISKVTIEEIRARSAEVSFQKTWTGHLAERGLETVAKNEMYKNSASKRNKAYWQRALIDSLSML